MQLCLLLTELKYRHFNNFPQTTTQSVKTLWYLLVMFFFTGTFEIKKSERNLRGIATFLCVSRYCRNEFSWSRSTPQMASWPPTTSSVGHPASARWRSSLWGFIHSSLYSTARAWCVWFIFFLNDILWIIIEAEEMSFNRQTAQTLHNVLLFDEIKVFWGHYSVYSDVTKYLTQVKNMTHIVSGSNVKEQLSFEL